MTVSEAPLEDTEHGRIPAGEGWGAYTVDEAAVRHGAGVDEETAEPSGAYARFPAGRFTRYEEGWLPGE